MRLKQDGEVGRGMLREVEGECRGDEAGGGTHAMLEGPRTKECQESVSAVENQSGKWAL